MLNHMVYNWARLIDATAPNAHGAQRPSACKPSANLRLIIHGSPSQMQSPTPLLVLAWCQNALHPP